MRVALLVMTPSGYGGLLNCDCYCHYVLASFPGSPESIIQSGEPGNEANILLHVLNDILHAFTFQLPAS